MSDEWPLRDDRLAHLLTLVPGLTDGEIETLAPRDDDDFGVALNLVLYSRYVDAVARGSKLYVGDYAALCRYRDDLEEGITSIADLPLRQRLIDALDLVDQQYLGCTVSGPQRWVRLPVNDNWWWWFRSPRRTDQRIHLDEEQGLRLGVGQSSA